MLDEMEAWQLVEWMAFDAIVAEQAQRAELAAAAEAGVQNYRRRGR